MEQVQWTSDAKEFMPFVEQGIEVAATMAELKRTGNASVTSDTGMVPTRAAAMRAEVATLAERLATEEWERKGCNFTPHVHLRHVVYALSEMQLGEAIDSTLLAMLRR